MIMFSINEYINSQRYSSLLLSSLCVSFYFCSVELLDQTKPGPQHFVTSSSSIIGIFVQECYVCLQISVLLSISSGGIIFLASKGLSLSLQVVLSLYSRVSITQLLLTRAAATPTTQVSLRSLSSYYWLYYLLGYCLGQGLISTPILLAA